MATVIQSIVQPDEGAIKAHLELLFSWTREEYSTGVVELRFGSTGPNSSQFFNTRPDGLDDAVAFAAARSRAGDNIYVCVNPAKGSSFNGKATSDDDIEIAAWQFADIDTVEALEGLGRKLAALPPTFTVTTGTTPHRRLHVYWRLDEPVRNLTEWTQRQRGIAQTLKGDSVINPSRIMRLAGTVSFPPQHKLQRGYDVELVTLKTDFEEEREPATPEGLAAAFPATQNTITDNGLGLNSGVSPAGGQTTLQAMQRTRLEDLIEACRSDHEWHNHMIRLVAHLASKGRSSAEILAMADHITLAGYTVPETRQEMAKALQSARAKYDMPEPEDEAVEVEEEAREPADSTFELFDMDELEAMPPPSWLVHETVVDDGLTIIYGDPGAGKSFVALDMALRLTNGMDWHGAEAKETGVLYVAGEGARGIGKRVKGWRKKHGLEGVEAPFLLLPIAVELMDDKQVNKLLRTIDAAKERAGFEIGLIVIDTVSRALAGSDENGQEAMGAFVSACDKIKSHAGGALIGVHHSGKDKERGMRGSTVLLGACDASIKLSKQGDLVQLEMEKQKDAEQGKPIYLHMDKVEWVQGLEPEQSTLVPRAADAPGHADAEQLSMHSIKQAFGIIGNAWEDGKPLSSYPQAKKSGRYAATVLRRELGGSVNEWNGLIEDWLAQECLSYEVRDSKTKSRGLRVLNTPGMQK